MAHLAIFPPQEPFLQAYNPYESEQLIGQLEEEIEDLNRLIDLKDKALEEIKQVVCCSLQESQGADAPIKFTYQTDKLDPYNLMTLQDFQSKDHLWDIKTAVSGILLQLDTAVNSVSSSISFKQERVKELNIQRKKKSSKSSRSTNFGKDNVTDNDTSIDNFFPIKIYEVPLQMEILKDIVEQDIQVDLPPMKSFIFQSPTLPVDCQYDRQVLSQHIAYQHPKIYQVPVQILQIQEIPVDLTFEEDFEENNSVQNIIYQIPIGLLSDSDKERFTWRIEELQEELQNLIKENEKLKSQKQITKIYEVPFTMSSLEEVHLEEIMMEKNKSEKSTNHFEFREEREDKEAELKNISSKLKSSRSFEEVKEAEQFIEDPHNRTKSLINPEKASVQSQTSEQWIEQNKIVKIPFVKTIEVPVFEEKIIEKIVKIPYLQPIEIKEIREETFDQEIQTQNTSENKESQTEAATTDLRVAKIPIIQPVEIPVLTDRIIKIPVLQTVEVPVYTDRIVKIPVLKTVEVPVETEKVIEKIIEIEKIVEVEKIVEKIIEKIKLVEVPIEVEIEKIVEVQKIVEKPVERIKLVEVPVQVEIPVIKEVPVELIIQNHTCPNCDLQKKPIIKEVPVEVIIEKVVEVPTTVEKIKIVEVPIEVQVQVVKEVEVIKEIEVIKEVEIIKQVEIIKKEVIVKQVPIEVEVIKQIFVTEVVEVPVEKIIIKQVPIEVVIEKEVQKIIKVPVLKQVPVEVVIQKEVQKIIKVPIIKQIPVEVIVEKVVEKIVKVPIIKEIPIEVEIEMIKEVKTVVEVPVIIVVPEEQQSEVIQVISCLDEQSSPIGDKQFESAQKVTFKDQIKIFEIPIELELEKEPMIIEKVVEKIVEVEKVVQVEKIKEVYIEVQGENIIEIPVLHEIPTIQYIPIEVIKEVKIPQIYQVPIEVQVEKIVEVQKIVEKEIVIQKIVYRDRLIQIPIELEMETALASQKIIEKVKEIPIAIPHLELVYVPVCLEHSAFSISSKKLISEQNLVSKTSIDENLKEVEEQNLLQGINQLEKQPSSDTLFVQLDYNESQFPSNVQEIIFQNPHLNEFIQTNQLGVQTEQIEDMDNDREQIYFDSDELESKAQPKVNVIEIPIQMEVIENEEREKEMELRHIDNLNILRGKYEVEIDQLNSMIIDLQKIITENNQDKTLVRELKEENALSQVSLAKMTEQFKQLSDLYQEMLEELKDKERQDEDKKIEINLLEEKLKSFEKLIQDNKSLQNQICQTEEFNLFEGVELIQVPVDLEILEKIENQEIYRAIANIIEVNEQQIIQSQLDPNIENFIQKKETDSELIDLSMAQKQKKNPQIYEIPVQIYIQKEIQSNSFSALQIEVIEVPVEILIQKQTCQQEIQTDHQNIEITDEEDEEYKIFEVPVEITELKEIVEIEIQTEKEGQYQEFEVQTEIQQSKKEFDEKIYEIPLEIDILIDKLQLKENKESETQTVENEFLNKPKLNIISGLNIFNYEERTLKNIKIYGPQHQEKDLSDGTQHKIARLGSEITFPNLNNYSNVQSMTPGGLQISTNSYDRFPPPVSINLSAIKKTSSNRSEEKFFGSLDMREDLINKEDPIASVRLANERLKGFADASSDEEEYSKNRFRIMTIQENVSAGSKEMSRDLNCIQTPNLQPHDLNFSEYAKFQQNMYTFEEEKPNYQQINENLTSEIFELKEQIEEFKQTLDQMQTKYEQQNEIWENKLKETQNKLNQLNREKNLLQLQNHEQKILVEDLEREKEEILNIYDKLKDDYDRTIEESMKNEKAVIQEIQKYRGLIADKQFELRQAKAEQHHIKMLYDNQLQDHRELFITQEQKIENLSSEIQHKIDKIDLLENALEEMRKNTALFKRNQEIDASIIYEREFQRIKIDFEDQKKQIESQSFDLRNQLQRVKGILAEEQSKVSQLNTVISDLEERLMAVCQENQQIRHLKSELQSNYIEDVKYLNCQLEELKDIIKQGDRSKEIILSAGMVSNQKESSRFRIQYLSSQGSRISREDRNYSEEYTKKLELLIMKYEEMLIEDHGTIEELQDKVCEYLKDALDKEQEAENLYIKLVDLENTLNNILVEKVSLEVENKRLLKSIELSEKKLAMLGNRLIEVARKRAQYDQEEEDYYE